MSDDKLLMYMLQNDSAIQSALNHYRDNYLDCKVTITAASDHSLSDSPRPGKKQKTEQHSRDMDLIQQHFQDFLYECTTYFFVLGFVVFRFCKVPFAPEVLIPVAMPIGEIRWEYNSTDDESPIQIPDIDIGQGLCSEHRRYYVYKFRTSGQYFSSQHDGILARLTHNYRRLVHARDYDLIIRNENLRKTVFIEQQVKADVSVIKQGSKSTEYGELQAIMDYSRGHQATTHSALPPTQGEEFRAFVTVNPLLHTVASAFSHAFLACFLGVACIDKMQSQGQNVKYTEAPEIEFIVMPANTHAKPMNAVFGNVDVMRCQQEYEKEILSILHIPSKEQQKDSLRQNQQDDTGWHKARNNREGALLSEITLCSCLCCFPMHFFEAADLYKYYTSIHV